MSYTTSDFDECVKCGIRDAENGVVIQREDIARVIAAWGHGEGMGGDDAGHYRYSEDGATEWKGGFLCALHDGRFAYIWGWCDYTGWG
jgi:hypothetical protein